MEYPDGKSFYDIVEFVKKLSNPPINEEVEVEDKEQERFNTAFVNDAGTIDTFVVPTIEPEEHFEDYGLESIEDYEPASGIENTDDLAWVDTTNFLVSARNLTEFLTEVLYAPEQWIGTIEHYEEYTPTGAYYIIGLSAKGLEVELEYTNDTGEKALINICIGDDNVYINGAS